MDSAEVAKVISGDGMPIGNTPQLPIQAKDVTITPGGATEAAFADDAAATIVWNDYQRARNYVDTNSWLLEWQYIDYMYQSPSFYGEYRSNDRTTRISRFNVAKNRNTMSCQVRRGVFAENNPFVLEPRGKLSGDPDAQKIIDAWTEVFSVLSDRADFEYNMRLFIECQVLQGTGIAIPIWEQKKVVKRSRVRKQQPKAIEMPAGNVKKINTWESDDLTVVEDTVIESWPCFEYRRLGYTLFDEKWRTPNRPDLSGKYRIDIDFVTFEDLQQMRELDCYKDIPPDEDLKKFFLNNPNGDADPGTMVGQAMNRQSAVVMHAAGENEQTSDDPLLKTLMKISRWTKGRVMEILCYQGRKKIIRNEEHDLEDHALGYTANWYNIENCGYGFGIGRLNVGDQRMTQGVLNEVLKMIAFPLNAPLLYDRDAGNAPTQNMISGLGTLLAVSTGKSNDIRKAFGFMEMPQIPKEAWEVYQLAQQGGEDLVGANSTTMQGNLGGPGSSAMRTAAGVNRVGGKADENISDPIQQLEQVISRWLQFLWRMVLEEMPLKEIRDILSEKYGQTILDEIDAEKFMNAKFEIKILAGQKLAAKAAIAQLIPFFLQLVQQPQLMEFLHQKGETINFGAIAKLFVQMSELQGREDIIVPLTPQQQQMVKQMQPGIQRIQQVQAQEKTKGDQKVRAIAAQGEQDMQTTLLDKTLDHVEGAVPLDLAEARLARNTDMAELQNGVGG